MTKRIIAASLAAAFSFGTAFGLALSSATDKGRTPPGSSAPDQHAGKPSGDALVCLDGADGQALCWPKELAPKGGTDTTCTERNGKTLCFTEPQQNKPEVEL